MTVSISDNSIGYSLSWFWNFGDGYTCTVNPPSDHTYSNPGEYTIILTVMGKGGNDINLQQINVYKKSDFEIIASKINGTDPFTVEFSYQSIIKPDDLEWNFGDDTVVKGLKDIIHTFRNPDNISKTFETRLSLFFSWGKVELEKLITVYPDIKCAFSITQQTESSLVLEFKNQSEGELTSWLWNFGDGFTSTEKNPDHEFKTPGAYLTTLTVKGTGGEKTCQKNIPPFAKFKTNIRNGVAPLQVNFTDLSIGEITNWLWDFGDSHQIEGKDLRSYTHTFTNPGEYTTSLYVSSERGSDLYNIIISVYYPPPKAFFEPFPLVGEIPLTVTFTNESSGKIDSFSWNFGNGSTNNVDSDPTYEYLEPGNYTVRLIASGPGGTDTYEHIVQAYPETVAKFTASPTNGFPPLKVDLADQSQGVLKEWRWDFGDGQLYNQQDVPEHTFSNPGKYTVSLIVQGENKKDTFSEIITVNEPEVNFISSETTGTAPLSVDFNNDSTDGFTTCIWNFGDGDIDYSLNPTHIYKSEGNYTVSLKISGYDWAYTKTRSDYIIVSKPNNHIPNKPFALEPNDNAILNSLTPTFKLNEFSDDDNDKHFKTQWQISNTQDFSSLLYDITTTTQLIEMNAPELLLDSNIKYYWRARVYDDKNDTSKWTDTLKFTISVSSQNDINNNGIPDDQEVSRTVDLDNDNQPDNIQKDIKTLKTAVGDDNIALKMITKEATIQSIKSIDPKLMLDKTNMPELPLGLVSFKLIVDRGAIANIEVYLSEKPQTGAKWYKYDPVDGWMDYSNHATIENNIVHIEIKDGGFGDADGVENGIIVDPSGIANFQELPKSDDNPGNCFISTIFSKH